LDNLMRLITAEMQKLAPPQQAQFKTALANLLDHEPAPGGSPTSIAPGLAGDSRRRRRVAQDARAASFPDIDQMLRRVEVGGSLIKVGAKQ
jgi:hypothetical protein